MSYLAWVQAIMYLLVVVTNALLNAWIIPKYVKEDKKAIAHEYTAYCYTALTALFSAEAMVVLFTGEYQFNMLVWLQSFVFVVIVIVYLMLQLWIIPDIVADDKKQEASDGTNIAFSALAVIFTSQALLTVFGTSKELSSPMGGRRR